MNRILAGMALATILALAGCGGGTESAGGDDALVIYSAHSDEIIAEFTTGFQAWYKRETGRDVKVSWPDPGGGGTHMLKRLEDKLRAGRFDVDVVFGGGGMIFEQMKQLGMLEPCRLPDDVLAAIPDKVAGQPIFDRDFCYYGAAISTFGILYNKTMIQEKGLPEVKDWETLADPKYLGLVGAGDASKSSSVRRAYEIILQAYGYEKGMRILVAMGANAREFYGAASDIPRNCAKGFVALGPCIDFYAFRQMRSEGGERLGFLAPSGLTVINADPIAILRKAPSPKVARKFVEFVMRPEGQRLWMLPAGAPGGPTKFTLERLSVLPSLYETAGAAGGAAARMNPFQAKPADFFDPNKENIRQTILADYLRVALVENHAGLVKAWKALIAAGLPEARVAELVKPLITEQEMLTLGKDVWTPAVAPDDASAEVKARLTRDEEARQRRKSDLETRWSEQLRTRYESLAK